MWITTPRKITRTVGLLDLATAMEIHDSIQEVFWTLGEIPSRVKMIQDAEEIADKVVVLTVADEVGWTTWEAVADRFKVFKTGTTVDKDYQAVASISWCETIKWKFESFPEYFFIKTRLDFFQAFYVEGKRFSAEFTNLM